ncbi:MAG: nucleotidyltransferase family protein [Candidatus ainarchaeum sp.]|nr:nucleotidyltransferase family protein [Candidatus ainarchaeum sp.]
MNSVLIKLKPKIVRVLKKHGVKKAGVFGSYAIGKPKKSSDVDILIDLHGGISLFGFAGIKLELEDALKKKVDLVEYSCIKPFIRESVLKSEVRIL